MEYNICPIPKPRMTKRDQWLKPPRSPVKRYWDFCLQCKLEKVVLPCYGAHIIFILPIPKSCSEKLKKQLDGKPHMQKPDLDNIFKALGDAIYTTDAVIYDIHITKRWGLTGKIIIEDSLNKDETYHGGL